MAGEIIQISTACYDFNGLITIESLSGFPEGAVVGITLNGPGVYSAGLTLADIPYAFDYVQNGAYTIAVTIDGITATGVQFDFNSTGPSADSSFTVDCAGAVPEPGPACTLAISDVAIAGDTITVTVTGANGATEYSLDAFQTVQSSNVFTGLTPETYFVYARDVVNPMCVAASLFKIYHVYGPKYNHVFDDVQGTSLEVKIWERDYTGPTLPLKKMGAVPVVVSLNGTDASKFHPIKPTECSLTILADGVFDFFDLYTADDRKYKVEILKGGVTTWQGFLIPNIYEQPYLPRPEISVKATDGLADLKNVDFKPFNTPLFPFKLSLFDAVLFCLYQMDLPLNILTGVNTYADGMDTAQDPLKQAYFYNSFPLDGKGVINCLDALTDILTPFLAKIRQSEGVWKIYDENNIASFAVRSYSNRGVFLESSTVSYLTKINQPSEGLPYFVNNSQHLRISPAYKTQAMHFDYGGFINFIPNGSFDPALTQVNGLPVGWTEGGNGEMNTTDPYGQLDGLVFSGYHDEATEVNPGFVKSPGHSLTLNSSVTGIKISFAFYAYKDGLAERSSQDADYSMLYYTLKVGGYYATGSNSVPWSTIETLHKYGTKQLNTKVEYGRYFPAPPAGGLVEVKFYEPFAPAPGAMTLDLVRIKDLAVNAGNLATGIIPFEDEDLTGTNPGQLKLKGETIELGLGDSKPSYYARGIYFNDANTQVWTNTKGHTGYLQEIALRSILDECEQSSLILDCDIKGDVGFDAVIYDDTLAGKRFITNSASWNLKSNQWQGQYLELITQAFVETGPYVDADYVLDDYVL